MAKCTVEVSCDWTGSGELTCYGHLSTDVSQAGGQYLEAGKLTCTPVEWPYPGQVRSHTRASKAPTKAYFLLKVASTAFTLKNLLRHCAKKVLTWTRHRLETPTQRS